MTAQIPDEFRYEGEVFSMVGMNGEGLYVPQDFGLKPRMASTGCYRGYILTFDCVDGKLILDRMDVNCEEAHIINGVEPVPGALTFSAEAREKLPDELKEYRRFKFAYSNLGLKTKFTGSLLLGKDFIESMYVHMGFQRPMSFKTVLEIQVQDGDIIVVNDLSEKMEELRERNQYKDARPDSMDQDDVHDWVEKSFSLDYEIE
jgi:hypothetical protein